MTQNWPKFRPLEVISDDRAEALLALANDIEARAPTAKCFADALRQHVRDLTSCYEEE